jgi:hypothetical protein
MKEYSSRASHLIVEKMDNTEKILCFIASGKWILTTEYVTNSHAQGRFLDEADYHVATVFDNSKLALGSYK